MSSLTAMRAELDKLATATTDDQKIDAVTNAWVEALTNDGEVDPDETKLLLEYESQMGAGCEVVKGEVNGITCAPQAAKPAPPPPTTQTQRPGSVHQSTGNARPGSVHQNEPPRATGPSEFAREAIFDATQSMRELNEGRLNTFGARPVYFYGAGYSHYDTVLAQQHYDRGFYMEDRLLDRFTYGGLMSPEFTAFYLAMGADMDWDQLGAGQQGLYWAVYETQMNAQNALDNVENALQYSNLNQDSVLGMKQELETFLDRPHKIFRGYFSWNQFNIDDPAQVRRAERLLRQINSIEN